MAAQLDENGRSPADVLRERERRWRLAEGKEPEEEEPNDSVSFEKCRTIAEVLRLRPTHDRINRDEESTSR